MALALFPLFSYAEWKCFNWLYVYFFQSSLSYTIFYLSPSILCLLIMYLLPCTSPPFLPSPSPLKALHMMSISLSGRGNAGGFWGQGTGGIKEEKCNGIINKTYLKKEWKKKKMFELPRGVYDSFPIQAFYVFFIYHFHWHHLWRFFAVPVPFFLASWISSPNSFQ